MDGTRLEQRHGLAGSGLSPTASPVVVFDGDCAICSRIATLVGRIGRGRYAVVPWQWADLDALGITPAEANDQLWFVDGDGQRSGGHLAVAALLRATGRGWSPVGWLVGHRPCVWLAGPLYRLIARNRQRLPGGTPACAVERPPEPD